MKDLHTTRREALAALVGVGALAAARQALAQDAAPRDATVPAIGGRRISEVFFAATATGGATFVLLAFHDAPKPAGGEVILGAITSDIDAFFARAVSAGGSLVEAPHELVEPKIEAGFVADVEGHLIEVVQQLT